MHTNTQEREGDLEKHTHTNRERETEIRRNTRTQTHTEEIQFRISLTMTPNLRISLLRKLQRNARSLAPQEAAAQHTLFCSSESCSATHTLSHYDPESLSRTTLGNSLPRVSRERDWVTNYLGACLSYYG